MNKEWAGAIKAQCEAAGVSFFMKQMGGKRKPFPQIPVGLMVREFPEVEMEGEDA
jgi:protein gp37